jgi:hypothetical protein
MDQTTRRLQDRELQEYCDRFTQRFLRGHTPLDVDVEVVGADIGDQHETELGRLHGLVYDSDTHELDVIFDSGEHHVFAIMQVWVLEEPEGFLRALQVRRPDGNQEIIRFAQAPLPAVPPQESRESREPRDSARPSA